MESRNVMVCLILGLFSVVLGYDIYLQHQTQLVTAKYYRAIIEEQQKVIDNDAKIMQKDAKFIKEHIEDIYKLFVLDSVRGYVTMDTLIRVFHYAKPHKSPVWNCPECADIRKKGLPNKQLPGERLTLPPNTDPERITHALSSSHKHGKDN
jgi:cell division protein FtsL